MAKTKKAGLLTKIVVLALLVYLATTLLNLQGRIASVQAERDSLTQQVTTQSQRNTQLEDAIENRDDPERINDVAREKLGLVAPGEKVFVFTN
jgi:cell division protein FtsL